MIYLILAILSSALVSIIMRLSEKHVSGNVGMLAVNYLMALLLQELEAVLEICSRRWTDLALH